MTKRDRAPATPEEETLNVRGPRAKRRRRKSSAGGPGRAPKLYPSAEDASLNEDTGVDDVQAHDASEDTGHDHEAVPPADGVAAPVIAAPAPGPLGAASARELGGRTLLDIRAEELIELPPDGGRLAKPTSDIVVFSPPTVVVGTLENPQEAAAVVAAAAAEHAVVNGDGDADAESWDVDIEVRVDEEPASELEASAPADAAVEPTSQTPAGADEPAADAAHAAESATSDSASVVSAAQRSSRPPPPPPEVTTRSSGARLSTETSTVTIPSIQQTGWWTTLFDGDYLRTVPDPAPELIMRQCDFIERRLKLDKGAKILDVGCGRGHHAIELAIRGYDVVGLDLSRAMIERACMNAEARQVEVRFVCADMRQLAVENEYDAVLCLGTTLGYFDDEGNAVTVRNIHRALKPGGIFYVDVLNRDFVLHTQPNLVWFAGKGCVCMEETTFNFITSRLEVKRSVMFEEGRQTEQHYSIRLFSLHELGQLLHRQSFRIEDASGDESTEGAHFGANSARHLIVAERRALTTAPRSVAASGVNTRQDNTPGT